MIILLSIQIHFSEIISLLAVIHCFVLSSVILFSKFFKSKSNRFLGYTLLVIAIVGINNWFWDRGISPLIVSVLDLFLWQFLYPVTLLHFFYRTSYKVSGKILNIKYFYLPFIVLSICNIIISWSTIFSIYTLPQIISNYTYEFYKGVSLLSILFPLYTIILSYRFAIIHKDDPVKKWLKHLWVYLSIILLVGVGLETYRFIFSEKLPLTYLWAFSSIFIYWLVYKGMYQFKLTNDRYELRTISLKDKSAPKVAIESKKSYFEKLLALIKEEKIHHNPNLSRDDVARLLNISSGYLSQIIKENASGNFSDFINFHRIEDVKIMLKDEKFDNYSILSIGLECGFNSKTSFYTNFKKETGLTPKGFKNK